MPIVDDLKRRITAAMKGGDTVARDVLRLALGEIQSGEARKNATYSEEEAAAALRKLIKSNEETLQLSGEGPRATDLRREIEVLTELLPARLTPDQIVEILASQRDAIKAAGNDGQATGIAMKHLKTIGAAADGKDVSAAVKKIRS
ncbi:MAG TPA: GatB/YqeY domain-containing protein [Labilithrix sp.]|jgi:hypothetical protein